MLPEYSVHLHLHGFDLGKGENDLHLQHLSTNSTQFTKIILVNTRRNEYTQIIHPVCYQLMFFPMILHVLSS